MTVRALGLTVRSLREGTRTRGPVLLRALLLAVLFLAVWGAQESSRVLTRGGLTLFVWVAWADLLLIMLLATSLFSTVITEEKELMSLGLLRLAGFTPASIILGKSAGLLLNAVLLLVVQVPFCMLAITLGGVHIIQVLETFALLLSFMVFCYGLALLCSVICQRSSRASSLTLVALLVYHVGPWAVGGVLVGLAGMSWNTAPVSTLLLVYQTSAWAALGNLTMSLGGMAATGAYTAMLVNLSAGVGLLLLSWSLFNVCNRNEQPAAPGDRVFTFRKSDERRSMRCWNDALFWKDFQFLCGGIRGLVIRTILYGCVVALLVVLFTVNTGGWPKAERIGEVLLGVMVFMVPMELGLIAARMFQQEVKAKTLGSLVSLPMDLRRVIWSKALGCACAGLPALAYFLLGAMLAPKDFGRALEDTLTEPFGWYVLSQIPLVLVLTVYMSLRFTRGAVAASIATVALSNILYWSSCAAMSRGGRDAQNTGIAFGMLVTATLIVVLGSGVVKRLRLLAGE